MMDVRINACVEHHQLRLGMGELQLTLIASSD